jgi:hypothetical protein
MDRIEIESGQILPKNIARLARTRYNTNFNSSINSSNRLIYMFDWKNTPEGFKFWSNIAQGNFNVFYEKYPRLIDNFSII